MKMRTILFLLIASALVSIQAFAARTATHQIKNATVNGSNFSFDIYSYSSGSTAINVGNTSYFIDVNQTGGFDFVTAPVISNVNAKYTSVDGNNNDYGTMDVQWITVGVIKKVAVTVYGTGNGAGTGSPLSNTGPDGEVMCTVTLKIADATQTSKMTWDETNSAMVTMTNANITQIYLPPSIDIALPVELVSFTALAQGRTVNLAWTTKTETSNYGFDVERKAVSSTPTAVDSWTKVGFLEGKGTSTTAHDYSFRDVVKSAGTFTYRLKQTDRDGKFNYSAQVEAKATLTADDYKLSQNYPNPFNPSTKFSFAVNTTQQVAVTVFNTLGQEVATLFNDVVPADQIQEVTFNGARLSSGIYFYVLRAQNRVEVKKMLMVK